MKRLALFVFLAVPLLALAQAPDQSTIDQAVNGISGNNWWLACGPLITLVVWFLRDFAAKPLPRVQAFLSQPVVSYLLPVLLGIAAGLGKAAQAGEKPSVGLISGVVIAALSKLTFLGVKNIAEQANGAVPKPPAGMVIALVGALLLLAGRAEALDLHAGPSLPLIQVTPGDKHPVALAPGAGFTVGVDLFPGKLGNRDVHVLTLAGDVFGSLESSATTVAGGVSIALHAALFELFTVGVGAKLFTPDKVGFLDGPASYRQSWFLMLGLDGGLVNFLQLGHLGQAPPPPPAQPCDGDHPCAGSGGGSGGAAR